MQLDQLTKKKTVSSDTTSMEQSTTSTPQEKETETKENPKMVWRDDFCYPLYYVPQTNYSINPKPDYSKQRNIITGYQQTDTFQEVILMQDKLFSVQ